MTITPASVRNLGIDKPKKVSEKANELERLLDVKCPMGLPRVIQPFGAVCKPTVCIELACKLNGITFAKEEAVKMSGVSMPDYQNTLITIQNILKLKFPVSVQELCIQFGCPGMKPTVDRLLEQYQERFLKSIPSMAPSNDKEDKEKPTTKIEAATASIQKRADFSNPAFKAAAFFLCARHCKLKVDRTKLIQHTNCNVTQFGNVCESMEKLCDFNTLLTASTFEEFREKSKKRKRNERENGSKGEDGIKNEEEKMKQVLSSVVPSEPAKTSMDTRPDDSVKVPPRKKLRQMNLNFFIDKTRS